ncbi:hypothetical protein CROQUDRAFT_133855 [Cronartium quercuum f. sp. fusiforme G11]|uniref:Phenylalanine ammonia-lyase n=1 Tax=Cronartium quercuum f. sp. fusiforme G11 TaxID=708437 RepID=A0A9P6NFR4_9BASI|nr:hypothetical protein CROQUDRAFT_133855 [Cronartium quercuum f. sp. fusiforme G11]
MAPSAFFLAGNRSTVAEHTISLKSTGPTATAGVQRPPTDTLSDHSKRCVKVLEELESLLDSEPGSKKLVLDGYDLSPTEVVANARYGVKTWISSDKVLVNRIAESVTYLESKLDTAIYGVTTGFGVSLTMNPFEFWLAPRFIERASFQQGSADTRTDSPEELQMSFLEHQLSGVLPLSKPSSMTTMYLTDPMANVIPEPITRGAILIRINSLVRGHSAVRLEVLETLMALLNKKLTPMVPLRGTISASGDLMPLSYVAAAICGHPDIRIMDRSSADGRLEILSAADALAKHNIKPIFLGPKEGLGISNGTAFSASAACLAAHDAHFLGLMSQVLTALSVEAMVGQAGNYHNGHLYVACMGIDLRVMDLLFRQSLADRMPSMLLKHFDQSGNVDKKQKWAMKLARAILPILYRRLEHTGSMDSHQRFVDAFGLTLQPILESLQGSTLDCVRTWRDYAAKETQSIYAETRDRFFSDVAEAYGSGDDSKVGPTEAYIGVKNREMYRFVRSGLGILPRRGDVKLGSHHGSVTTDLSKVYESMRSGELYKVLKRMF